MHYPDMRASGHALPRSWRLCIPAGIYGLYLCLLYWLLPSQDFFVFLGLAVTYLLPPAGKESVIPLGIVLGEAWWLVALTCALLDIVCALFVVWNFDLLLSAPLIGPVIRECAGKGKEWIAAHHWLARMSYAGLFLFVLFPLQGSGGINATIIGRMLGMGVIPVVFCITAGSVLGCVSIAMGAAYLNSALASGGTLILAVPAAVALAGSVLFLLRRQAEKA
ncbi:MAG: small multi-drug export protein [Methanomicrobiales archaeon]|nr:small multi-drug export protein [Methanomicrobiales archaeon]